ncbi:MAG TPA: methyltransferase domain-containing protein, partial [Nitrospira sp.]|nr:methyltransferase domain-containing protein [Nitrospira sp.]
IEQEYTYLRHEGLQISREALCAAHLSQLDQLGNLHEYRKLLDDLYGFMSPLDPGTVLVDAGIGESELTRTALVNHTYRARQATWTGKPSPLMIGVDRSSETISHARHAVHTLQRELSTGFVGRLAAMPPLSIGWVQADPAESLPFNADSLHRLVSTLSLPYVSSPLAALREWYRVLHPEGRLILTTFHPDTDFSTLYRRHLRQANQDEFSAQAQPLLHHFGRLREAIRHRILHTFDQAALSALLRQCGMTSFRILPVFDGQALVAVVGKRNSSSSF